MHFSMKAVIVFVLALCRSSAETRTVCEALADLGDLNGKEVRIRGAFNAGHTGQELFASPPCSQPTIRDGWVWRDFIRVYPAGGTTAVAGALAECHRTAVEHPGCRLVVTLTGRLETRSHFDVTTFPGGLQIPVGFKWFVARLLYRAIDGIEAVRLQPGELERDLEMRARPYAVRPAPDSFR
jgi:hypothetical protein